MSDNFNINTTQDQSYVAGGMDPNNPGETLWQAMNKGQLQQNEQAELVKQAVEKSKQAQMTTSEQAEDEKSGARQGEKGLISKAQALTTLKAGLANSGIEDDQKAAVMKDAEDTWPEVVSADGVHRMITALHEGRITKLGEGNPFQATGTETDEDGTPFAKGTYIQSVLDTNGDEHFIHSNKPASVQNHGDKEGGNEKQWHELEKLVAKYTQGGRGQMLMNTVIRSKQALSLILEAGDNPTRQVLGQISNDISSIMSGGAGTDKGVEIASYENMLADLNNKLGYYTGKYNMVTAGWKKLTDHTGLEEIMSNLRKTLISLINIASETIKAQLESVQAGYRTLIETDPERFDNMIKGHMHIMDAGLPSAMLSTGAAQTPGAPQSTGNPQATPTQTTAKGTVFSVEE